ncbi:MAG: chemotaxis protein CheA [Planctomycetaceae bacterium]|nr:MAG: chemotaxis protein CheA [Planctomycetaceae bacterium]
MDRHVQTFLQEADELIIELESVLLEMEESPDDLDLVNRAFRAIHTIKGSSSMFGLNDITDFTHHVETVFDLVREGRIPVTKQLTDLTLKSCDQIKLLLNASVGGPAADAEQINRIVAGLNTFLSDKDSVDDTVDADTKVPSPTVRTGGENITYRMRFRPDPAILRSGMDPSLLLDELYQLGECTIVAQIEDIPVLDELNAEQCYLFWDVILTTDRGVDAIKDVFIFVEDESEISIREISDDSEDINGTKRRLGEILVDRGDITRTQVDETLSHQKRIGEMLVESGAVSKDKVESALKEQQILDKKTSAARVASVRVPADRLDKLINLVGELVITQARLTQIATTVDIADLVNPTEEIERLTGELRDCVLNIRMLPIGTTFSKFRRLVRDLSAELGKEIDLVTEGGETELDKTVIERLDDPLVHLIRNSIDHGIESPDERSAAGKPRKGKILLTATHAGASVVITIEDNGKGLDPEVIKSKATEKGLIGPGAVLDESEIFKFIFMPGFSMAKCVTNVSGRGVGMDVVKREIDALRGSIEISSKKGRGTTIALTLPLTLAIIDGLLVKVEESRFVLPLAVVEECVTLLEIDIANAHNRHVISVRGELIPYVRLREIFVMSNGRPSVEQIAIVRNDGIRVGIVVDEIIGDHQTVIKSLGRAYRDVEGVSGATIMGDGSIALIVDVPKLIRCAEREETAEFRVQI